MSEDILDELVQPSELDALKARADALGLNYSPNIGVDTLRKRVADKLAGIEDAQPVEKVALVKTAAQTKHQVRMHHVREAKRLVRVRVMNMNPNKKDWKGEVFTVSNAVVGTIRRFVPYDVEWHAEDFIVKQIKARKMSRFYEVKNEQGMKVKKYRLVPEFSVEELNPLTKGALKALAEDQAKRGVYTEE